MTNLSDIITEAIYLPICLPLAHKNSVHHAGDTPWQILVILSSKSILHPENKLILGQE